MHEHQDSRLMAIKLNRWMVDPGDTMGIDRRARLLFVRPQQCRTSDHGKAPQPDGWSSREWN
ncbi:MAG: hypothetical protein R3C05_28965 [Pirellulaceae bacterium]